MLRYMIGKKDHLRDFRKLEGVGDVKFGNNHRASIRGYRTVNFQLNVSLTW